MSPRRRSYESGHRRKYLVVIDDTRECDRAVYYASRRAARTSAGVVMLRVIGIGDRGPQWLGVADIMRAEAQEAAAHVLARFADRVHDATGITAERVMREGETAPEVLRLIDEDADIAVLVLAAAPGPDGPGPLLASLAGSAGTFPIPLTVVPGHLGDDELDAMT
jgi:nucleotide-binding universal stress UspA family protein